MRSRRAALLVSLALLAGTVLAAKLPSAGAAVAPCPCVILIEVDGLEPKDVTPENTPFLWELAHPETGQQLDDAERAGWTWQAPRAVMSAGTAANSAALLTGSYPKQHGIPADEFVHEDVTYRLESNPLDGASQISENDWDSETLLETLPNETSFTPRKQSAAFVGNPALSGVADVGDIPDTLKWWPTNDDPENPPSPAYCDVPRETPDEQSEFENTPCSAPDMVTMNRAFNALSDDGENVALTYIHLAELGVIKRRDGDFTPGEQAEEGEPGEPGVPDEIDSPAAQDSLPHALAQVDAAVASFINRYKDESFSPETAAKWDDTYVMVVGSHGYETAPYNKRLPSPNGPTDDLEKFVESGNTLKYSAYGSMATIHATQAEPDARAEAIQSIAHWFRPGGEIEAECGEPCIEEVLYVREDLVPPEIRSDPDELDRVLLSRRHEHWNFDHLSEESPFAPTRASGELVVITKPGWAAGRALPQPTLDGLQPSPGEPSDPYLGVAGGPRNRAVAAIVHGPRREDGVRQVGPARYPVTATPDEGQLNEDPEPKYATLREANADPRDDTEKDGHERQPEHVDFAPTIAALLGIGLTEEQNAGRFLQEAFRRPLGFPDLDPPPPPEPDPVIEEEPYVEPEPEVIILPPPPVPPQPKPKPPWDYRGLVRDLRAAVGDRRGRVFPNVRPGVALSYLILRADFGKPLASVKLSFYRQQRDERTGRTGHRRVVVKTLASFAPFSVKRAKDANLKLKVPAVFKPTHVGVVVQQARKLSGRELSAARRARRPTFKAYGARAGGIYRIKHANRLHTRAPKRARKRSRPRARG
jgi:hypothetical protein